MKINNYKELNTKKIVDILNTYENYKDLFKYSKDAIIKHYTNDKEYQLFTEHDLFYIDISSLNEITDTNEIHKLFADSIIEYFNNTYKDLKNELIKVYITSFRIINIKCIVNGIIITKDMINVMHA